MKQYNVTNIKRLMLARAQDGDTFLFIDHHKSKYPMIVVFDDGVEATGASVPEILKEINEKNQSNAFA